MLSLLKKNTDKAKALQASAWHTNFRNLEALPDTKLIRTSFYVNGLLLFVAIAAVFAFAWQEYSLGDVRRQTRELQVRIDNNKAASQKAVDLYAKFKVEEQKINELNNFLKGQKLVVSDFIIQLGQTKPAGIVLLNVDYRDTGVNMRGYAQGISEQATSAASTYEKLLRDDPKMSAIFKSISIANVSRDIQAGRLMFEINLSFNSPKAK